MLYGHKWHVFENWFSESQAISFQCFVRAILSFLQDLIEKGKAFSCWHVCHVGFNGKTVGQHPLVCGFMTAISCLHLDLWLHLGTFLLC